MNRLARTKRNAKFSPWLVTSLFVHSLLIPALLFMNSGTPYGTRVFGSHDGAALSLTWIPGNSSGSQGTVDTVIQGAENDGAVEGAVVSSELTVEPASKFVVDHDPETVFDEAAGATLPLFDDEAKMESANKDSRNPTRGKSESHHSVTDYSDDSQASKSSAGLKGRRAASGGDDGEGQNAGGGRVSTGAGENRIEFFGIQSRGKRVVYLIDASESMRQHRAIDLAREELWRSLSDLKSTSQFQIVFFDLTCHTFSLEGNRGRLVTATSQHLRLAKQFMAGIRPDSGTDRLFAMTHALSFDPEIVFLLTDVDAPELTAHDLSVIRRSNKRQALIHAVEFGIGPDLSQDSFLKKLARQNRGTHRYVDLKAAHP